MRDLPDNEYKSKDIKSLDVVSLRHQSTKKKVAMRFNNGIAFVLHPPLAL